MITGGLEEKKVGSKKLKCQKKIEEPVKKLKPENETKSSQKKKSEGDAKSEKGVLSIEAILKETTSSSQKLPELTVKSGSIQESKAEPEVDLHTDDNPDGDELLDDSK